MSIPSGHIVTVGALNIIDRLQDSGLQSPKVPTEVIRETGNDLVVGKVLTEAAFTFQMTSWDTNCDMMAMLLGQKGDIAENHGPAHSDAKGTKYAWENCQFVNLACPWARDSGTAGGDIASGVLIPSFYPSALSYKFGVTANAEQSVTLEGGSYYMSEAYPMEEFAEGTGVATVFTTSEAARAYAIGGFGSESYRHVFGVLVDGVIQQEGVDYVESEGTPPEEAAHAVKITFAKAPANKAVIRYVYFSTVAHALPQEYRESTTTSPAAVRGRDIDIILGEGEGTLLRGVQDFTLNATHAGSVQREMGTQDPIGYNETGIDCNGTMTLDPKEEKALYEAISLFTGLDSTEEVIGYINEHTIPLKVVIHNPKKPSEILKSIVIKDALIQPPGTTVKVNTAMALPVSWESESGTFEEIKEE